MAMSDCAKCWETPCGCGWEYRDYTPERRADLIAAIMASGPVADLEPYLEKNRAALARMIAKAGGRL